MKQLLTLVVLVCAPVSIFPQTKYMTDHGDSHNNYDTNFGGYSSTLQLGSAGGGLAGSLDNFFNPRQLALGFGLGLAKAMVLAALGAGFSASRGRSHRNYNPDKSYGHQNSAYISKSITAHPGNNDRYRGDTASYEGRNPYTYSIYLDHTLGGIGDYKKKSGHSYGVLPHQETSGVSYMTPNSGQTYGNSYTRITNGDYNMDQIREINGKYGDMSTSTFSYGGSNGVNDYKDTYRIQPSHSYNTIARSGSVRYKANDYSDNYNNGYSSGNAKYGGERNTGLDLFSLHRRFAKAKTTLLRGLLSPLASLNIFGGGSSGQETYQRSKNNYDSHSANPNPSFSLSPSLGLGAYLGAKAGLIKGVIMSRVLSDSGILKSDDGY